MQYTSTYNSPLGEILLAVDDKGLTGLWFEGQKYFAQSLEKENMQNENSFIKDAKLWLDIYFSGKEPDFLPKIHFVGTEFQISVWKILQKIPYGKTITYGEISKEIARQKGLKTMSSQAVGGAVGHNKISIIVPCHRVVGTNKSLTGYAGGVEKKVRLLSIEGVDVSEFSVPKN